MCRQRVLIDDSDNLFETLVIPPAAPLSIANPEKQRAAHGKVPAPPASPAPHVRRRALARAQVDGETEAVEWKVLDVSRHLENAAHGISMEVGALAGLSVPH